MTSAFLKFIVAFLCFISVAYAQKNATPPAGAIAYVRGGTEVRIIGADGTNDRRLWTHPDAKKELGIYGVAWRPDGKELIISSGHAAAYSLYHSDLYAIRPDGTGFRKVTNSPDRAEFARYPKGSVSVTLRNDQPSYQQSQASAGVFIVYVAGADEPQQITLPPGATKTILFKNVADFGNMAQAVVAMWGKYRWFTTGVDVRAAQTVKAPVFAISGDALSNTFRLALVAGWVRVSVFKSDADAEFCKHLPLRFRDAQNHANHEPAKRVHGHVQHFT